MNFEGEAFISYAHLDNVELVEGRRGWVANLHRALEVRVAQLLGKPPNIWRDPKLSGNDVFADILLERLKRVAVLVTVISPRYLKSEWTLRELNEFWHAAEAQGGVNIGSKARVFKVLKTPVPLDKTPPELRGLIGYDFFRIDPDTGKVRELDEVFGPEAQRDFWIKLDDLAHDVAEIIELIEGGGVATDTAPTGRLDPQKPPPGTATPIARTAGVVYLAETTSDLREQRDALKRDLQQQGYTVLPDRPVSYLVDEAQAAIREDLARCRMSIHPIGRKYSLVPEGATESLIELQHELATERAQRGDFSRLLWIPNGLQVDDDRQRQVIERLKRDPRIRDNADLLETFFEDLRTMMGDWLEKSHAPAERAQPAAGGAARRVYIMADARDAGAIGAWVDPLFNAGLEVIQPIFEGDEAEIREYHEENLASCDGVLIFYGSANELWLRRKLREVQKAVGYGRTKPAPPIGVALIGTRTPEKERFRTHEAHVIAQWDGCAIDQLAPFLSQVKSV
jgi:hypothetical protein